MSDNHKVLFVTASTTGGGAERMLFNIIRSLDSSHCARLFITSDEAVPAVYRDNIISMNANKRHAVQAFPSLLNEIKVFQPDSVFTTSSNVGYMLILAKRILRARFKIYIRCAVTPSEIYHSDFKSKLLNRIIRHTYQGADLIIAQTDFMRNDLIRAYGLNGHRVRTIRNIVDKEFISRQAAEGSAPELSRENFNIVAAGALYSVKGFDLLIEAIAPAIRNTNRHLYILGEERYEPGYRNLLQQQIEKSGVSGNIHLLGHKSNPYPYLKEADLFIMSSRKEGYPNVVLEALALSTPVIATDCVDWTGVIEPGKNGYIVRKNDMSSMRSAIYSALQTDFNLDNLNIENYNYNELFT